MNGLTPQAITLAVYNKSCTEFGVTWQTEVRANPVLEYTDEADSAFERAVRVEGVCSDGTGTVKNTAVIRGVRPGEKCRWRVGDESGVFSDSAVFRAPELDEGKLTFLVMTDSQDGENRGEWLKFAWHDAVRRFPEARLLVNAGDIVQEGGNAEMWAQMFGINEEFLRFVPMAPVAGNHDYWYGYLHGFDAVCEKHFKIDLPPQDTRHGMYYSFDCGPAHFTVLSSGDSMETDGTGILSSQLEWAENDIASSDKPWKIVAVHNPLYSPGKYGCIDPIFGQALGMQRQLDALFVKYGVDLVLCGHDHVYAVTYPISADSLPVTDCVYETVCDGDGEIRYAVDPAGPIHFEAGCAGNQNREIEEGITERFSRNFADMSDMTYRAVAYAAVSIDGGTLTVRYRENSVDTGECVKYRAFGIKKAAKGND